MDECLLSDLLECSVCLDRLDTSSRVLPCQHTFCRKCLEEIVATKKELRCPECRVLVAKPIDELPPNVLLMRILEGMKNAGNPIPRKKAQPVLKPASFVPNVVSSANLPCTGDTPKKSVLKEPGISGPPLGRALFDYQSQEPEDLSFRKGEMITLLSKIDAHWAHGECAGRTGIFPLTFVQVLTPVSPQVATCKALYDFRMNNEEVEGCLSFRKDEILAVLRRVDENWIEGRLNGRIGIFPLAFVELNSVAKALMKLSINEQPGPSRLAPPTPTTEESSPLIQSDSRSNSNSTPERLIMSSNEGARPTPGPMAPVSGGRPSPATATPQQPQAGRPAASDSSSTTTTTPNSSSNSSGGSSSSTAASSPASPLQTVCFQKTSSPQPPSQVSPSPAGVHQRPLPVQRCAQSPYATAQSSPSQQMATPQEPSVSPLQQTTECPQMSSLNPFMRPAILLPTSHITAQQRDKRHSFTAVTANQSVPTPNRHSAEILSANDAAIPPEPPRSSTAVTPSEVRTQGVGQARDTPQLAVPSRDQPSNGLVRHGSQRHRRSGSDFAVVHLPAAYVALYPYKPQKADELELKKGGVYLVTERCQDGWFKGTSNRTQKCGVFPGNYVTLAKPMQNSHSRVVSSSPRDCATPNREIHAKPRTPAPAARQSALANLAPPELPPRSASPAVRPARHPWGLPSSTPPPEPESLAAVALGTKSDSSSVGHSQSISNTISPPPNVSVALSPTSIKPGDKVKEKKEKGGIMKRLAAIKRSKSPTVPAYSMDNPVFEDSSVPTLSPASSLHVAHSRSGSCPSQLLHLPVGVQSERVMSTSLSARSTRQKERPSVGAAHFTQSPSRIDSSQSTASAGNSHRKSSSLDAGDPRNVKHLVPSVRERFRCIVPYPPNSEYELELRIGDIIYVHRKRDDGWYKGTQQRTGRTGLFPASFVESY